MKVLFFGAEPLTFPQEDAHLLARVAVQSHIDLGLILRDEADSHVAPHSSSSIADQDSAPV
jgi:hypothetical protein